MIRWLIDTFSPPVLASILFAAIALFPLLLLPTVPVKWVVGMTFGYGVGFLLIMAGVAVAVTLPYFIAYYFFLDKLEVSRHFQFSFLTISILFLLLFLVRAFFV